MIAFRAESESGGSGLELFFKRYARNAGVRAFRNLLMSWLTLAFPQDTVAKCEESVGERIEAVADEQLRNGVLDYGSFRSRGALRGAAPFARKGSRKPQGFRRGESRFPSHKHTLFNRF